MAAAQAKREGVSAGDPGTPPLVFVTVVPPVQVVHHAQTFGPGETAQVPEDVAAHWITCGWVAKQ